MRSETATGTGGLEGGGRSKGGPGAKARRMVAAMVMTAASYGEKRVGQEGRGRTASSKVGKKPRKGLCLVHGPAGGRKLRVFLWPSHSVAR